MEGKKLAEKSKSEIKIVDLSTNEKPKIACREMLESAS